MSKADHKDSKSPAAMIKNPQQLQLMKKSGEMTARALKKVLESVREGVSLEELDRIAEEEIKSLGGESSFKTVPGYNHTTCLTVNDEVVHGLPRNIKLREGDTLAVDLGAVFEGWHTDAAWTVVVGEAEQKVRDFLQTGEEALAAAVRRAVLGSRIGDISSAIQQTIEGANYSVVKSLAGHGVGRSGHEEPEIPTYGQPGSGIKIREGMTLAIEAIYTAGEGLVYEKNDGWTIATLDGSRGGLFEMSVIITKGQAEVITDWRKV